MLLFNNITKAIIGASFDVYKELGYGFLEKVYQRSMQVELQSQGFFTNLGQSIKVKYKNILVGDYMADLIVSNKVIVELKVAKKYNPQDEAQILNELKATEFKVGLLINFGKEEVEFKRFIY